MKRALRGFLTGFVLLMLTRVAGAAADATPAGGAFAPIAATALDKTSLAEWVDGREKPFAMDAMSSDPTALVWTAKSRPQHSGRKFGEGRATGVRRLRIGFNEPTSIGSVLVRGGGALGVLKPDAKYPGNLADDSQWIAAERIVGGQPSQQEIDNEGFGLWVLPAGTETRALRFTHTPTPGDREMAGWLGGVWINRERVANVAPQALVQSTMRDDASAKIVDESNNRTWGAWDNGEHGAAVAISPEHPEMVTFTWPRPVELSGVCLIWAGLSAAEVDAFTGGDSEIVGEAPATAWQRVAMAANVDNYYPLPLGPHWLAFEKPLTTRALRLRITGPPKLSHPHLQGKGYDGRRVWLGELMALAPLTNTAPLASLVLPKTESEPPPIPVRFALPEAGVVTLVIEDGQHKRIRNLVSETPFPAGENVAWWDGSDDALRDPQAAHHGVYHIPARPVAPGSYQVRGLWHKPVSLHYEFSVYSAGKPAWETADSTGCWMTTHTPPTSACAVPGKRTRDGEPLVFLGAFVAEGGHGLQWLHEDGTKLGGQGWIGGAWTGAETLATDLGLGAVADDLCYVGSLFEGELRLTAKTKTLTDRPIFKQKLGDDPRRVDPATKPSALAGFDGGDYVYVLAGIAVHDGVIVSSLVRQNELLVVEVAKSALTARIALDNPRGVAFDVQGRLLALSGKQLVRFNKLTDKPVTIVASGLEDPHGVTCDHAGNILISDRGKSHQVKKFSADGKLLSTFGVAGAPAAGPYDPRHMNNPNGIAVDSQGRLWVTEDDNSPRRVSLWSPDGKLLRAFYGPTEYGGGGKLDPRDPKRFFYRGLEFALDWDKGTDELKYVYFRPDGTQPFVHNAGFWPDTPIYPPAQPNRRYFTSCYTHNPTMGDGATFIWRVDDGQAHLVAGMGDAQHWPVMCEERFQPLWPKDFKPHATYPKPEELATFAWSDTNGDGVPQVEETKFIAQQTRGLTVMDDLSIVAARFGEQDARFVPTFDAAGLPKYDLDKPEVLGPAAGRPPSSGGDQSLTEPGGWTIDTIAPLPYSPFGLGGMFRGEPRWSYPSPWPGLHPSHEAAVPDQPGMVVGHTRLLGGWISGSLGPMFCINANMGNMYLFTADGLFVSTLFHDVRLRPYWAAPVPTRNMDVTDVSLHDENFWPSITQTPDGRVFLVDGGRTSLVRVDGLETLHPIEPTTVTVSEADLDRARDWFAKIEAERHEKQGSGTLQVPLQAAAPQVDGKLDDWPATTDWAAIDRRGTRANFNSNSRPYEVSAAVWLTDTQLFAAWRTTEKDLLTNSGETPLALFKHGGCLDIMLATDPAAAPNRAAPVAGDERLLITRVKDKTRALLYRAKVPGKNEPVGFSSPWRTVSFDAVEDVSDQVTLADGKDGNFEISIPLAALHWKPQPGQTYQADIGVLRGTAGQTTQRVYWSNKATAITADVPSEAELTPRLWGKWKIGTR